MRRLVAALAASSLVFAACGEAAAPPERSQTEAPAPPAKLTEVTKDGRSNEAAATPGAQQPTASSDAVSVASTKPCGLVSSGQAKAILGKAVRAPLEAPQGPTCIYRTKTGESQVTLAIEFESMATLTKRLQMRKRVVVGDRRAYCGVYGQDVLYAQISDEWVLSIAGPCDVAQRFAARALSQLS